MNKLITMASAAALLALSNAPVWAADRPGPSATLLAQPYYRCLRNFYVSLNGSDANAGTRSAPYATLEHAQDLGELRAGDCVNALPGKYLRGVYVSAGGNRASSTGYIVYRCAQLDACVVTDETTGGIGSFVWNNTITPMRGSYVMIDGFHLDATARGSSNSSAVTIATNKFVPSAHHVWIINSIIENYGASGAQLNQGEYFYVVHNEIRSNANRDCVNHGSGVSYAGLIKIPGYQSTADDLSNPMLGNISAKFHNAIEWNTFHNNVVTCTAEKHYADGNGVVLDTLNWSEAPGTTPYVGGVLVAFNVLYNNGGSGVNAWKSDNVTIANNTCWNNNLNLRDWNSFHGCIMSAANTVVGNTIINNIAVAIPGAHTTCSYQTRPYSMWNSAFLSASYGPVDTLSHNVSFTFSRGCAGENFVAAPDTYSCTFNRCATDPHFASVGTVSLGNENNPPRGANFALQSNSRAIGFGLREPYLDTTSIDAGACFHSVAVCP